MKRTPEVRNSQSKALTLVDDVVDNQPIIVRRDHRIVAAFAPQQGCRILGTDALLGRRKPVCRPHRK